jgi:hypothetical protein
MHALSACGAPSEQRLCIHERFKRRCETAHDLQPQSAQAGDS